MTLIVGLHGGSQLLLSADSGVFDNERDDVAIAPKLKHAGPFAWGFSGYEPLGHQFDDWMQRECDELARLGDREFETRLRSAVNRINEERWAELQGQGLQKRDLFLDHFVHIIVAGYVGHQGILIRIVHSQPSTRLINKEPTILSLGADDLAQKALSELHHDGRWTADRPGLQRLMDMAITFGEDDSYNLRRPVRILRVSPAGCEDVSDESFRKRFPAA